MKRAGRRAVPADAPYEKISATLERSLLRSIRERTDNVSGFLNRAAADKLYFDRVGDIIDDLKAQGVERDEKLYRRLNELVDSREKRRRPRSAAGRG